MPTMIAISLNRKSIAMAATVATTCLALLSYYGYGRSSRRNTDSTNNKGNPTEVSPSPSQVLTLIRRRRSIFPKQYTSMTNPDAMVPLSIIKDMLEAARWAPSHHLTEPWRFVVLSSESARAKLGHYLASNYRQKAGDGFSQTKFDKKFNSCMKASHVICVFCALNAKNPAIEEACSVAGAVQNMHLVATSYRVGAYWSTSGIYDPETAKQTAEVALVNPPALLEQFLGDDMDGNEGRYVCLGWMFVGSYDSAKAWPEGRRKPCMVEYQ